MDLLVGAIDALLGIAPNRQLDFIPLESQSLWPQPPSTTNGTSSTWQFHSPPGRYLDQTLGILTCVDAAGTGPLRNPWPNDMAPLPTNPPVPSIEWEATKIPALQHQQGAWRCGFPCLEIGWIRVSSLFRRHHCDRWNTWFWWITTVWTRKAP